jgi:hypothetical protein
MLLFLALLLAACADAETQTVSAPTQTVPAPTRPPAVAPSPSSAPTQMSDLPSTSLAPRTGKPTGAIHTVVPPDDGGPSGYFTLTGLSADNALDVHSRPGAGSPVIGALAPGAAGVTIIGLAEVVDDVTWTPIAYGGLQGWVDQAFLTRQEGSADPALAALAAQTIQAIASQDFPILAALVHPAGLRFAPYSYLSAEDLVFTPEEVRTILASSKTYLWGTQDGSGLPIERSFPAYYKDFIYDVDFARPELIRYNTNVEIGSRINNILEVYPDAAIVEYFFSGFEPENEGMDWRSLRLVFLPYQDSYRLAAIVHDEWGP